jgi:hypothetical protein
MERTAGRNVVIQMIMDYLPLPYGRGSVLRLTGLIDSFY